MANWLQFDKIENWEFLVLQGFQYDEVTDQEITAALRDMQTLSKVDPYLEWQDDKFLMNNEQVPENRKHSYRIAALVLAFRRDGGMVKGIELDTFSNGRCCSCVGDGHHRIRSLQYQGLPAGPFELGGVIKELENLVSVAGTSIPEKASSLVAPRLLMPGRYDIKLRKRKAVSPLAYA